MLLEVSAFCLLVDDISALLRICEAYFLTLGDETDRLYRNVL